MNILFKYDHILCKQTIRVKKLTLEYTYQVKKEIASNKTDPAKRIVCK